MNYQTYLFFEGRTEYVQGYDTPQHTYPLGSLVFGVLDLDTAPYLERGRTLLEKFRGVEFSEDQTMQQSLAAPDNQKMRDDYNAWRKQAQMALSKYQLGEIGWEEFEGIILKNK